MAQITTSQIKNGTIHDIDIAIDAAINFSKISIVGTYIEDLMIAVHSMKVPLVDMPNWNVFKNNGSGSVGVYGFYFTKNNNESLLFNCQIKHSYKPGTALIPHVHYLQPNNLFERVVWGLEYLIFRRDNVCANVTTISTNEQETDGMQNKHRICYLPEINGMDLIESDILFGRLFRNGSNARDTVSDSILLLGFDFHFQVCKLGTS